MNPKFDLSSKMKMIDDSFIKETITDFKESIFPDRANIMKREEFVHKLTTDEFQWLFSMQIARDKIDKLLNL